MFVKERFCDGRLAIVLLVVMVGKLLVVLVLVITAKVAVVLVVLVEPQDTITTKQQQLSVQLNIDTACGFNL